MRPSVKVFSVMLFLLVLIVSFMQFFTVHSEALTLPEKALGYTENILPIDVKQYNITLDSYYTLPSAPSDTSSTEAVAYRLISNESKLRVLFLFKNGEMYQCGFNVEAGSVINARSYANLTDVARDVLEKYQAFTGADSTEMITTLSLVDETKYMTVSLGNVNLTVSHMAIPKTMSTASGHMEAVGSDTVNVTSFNWVYVSNGAQYNTVYVSFENGVFHTLWDDRAITKIGSTDVNFTKEQALDAALKYVENYTYVSGNATVSGFNVAKDRADANLQTAVKDDNTLYPCWIVTLYLNQTYPDGVKSLLVKVWAGSGEVFECSTQTLGGSLPFEDSNPESTPTPQPEDSASPTAIPFLPSDSASSTLTPDADTSSLTVGNAALSSGASSTDLVLVGLAIAAAIAAGTVFVLFIRKRGNSKAALS